MKINLEERQAALREKFRRKRATRSKLYNLRPMLPGDARRKRIMNHEQRDAIRHFLHWMKNNGLEVISYRDLPGGGGGWAFMNIGEVCKWFESGRIPEWKKEEGRMKKEERKKHILCRLNT